MNLEKIFVNAVEHKGIGPSIGKTSTPTGFEHIYGFYAALVKNGRNGNERFNVQIASNPFCTTPYRFRLFKRSVSQERAREEYDKLE